MCSLCRTFEVLESESFGKEVSRVANLGGCERLEFSGNCPGNGFASGPFEEVRGSAG